MTTIHPEHSPFFSFPHKRENPADLHRDDPWLDSDATGDLESYKEQVQDWISRGAEEELTLQGISAKDFEHLDLDLAEKGIKIRSDWFAHPRGAVLRMAEGIHDIPGAWLTQVLGELSSRLAGMARCGQPEVTHVGTKRMTAKHGKQAPDLYLRLLTHLNGETHISVGPQVLLETAYSQKLASAMEKAFDYLYDDERNTHAVIICDMTYPVSLTRNFKADISVWVRPETGNLDEDYPLEDLGFEHEPSASPSQSPTPQPHIPLSPNENLEGALDRPHSTTDASSPSITDLSSMGYSGTTTATEDRTSVDDLKSLRTYGNGAKKIIRRTEKAIVVYDETNPDVRPGNIPVLPLDAYDFIRVCSKHKTAYISDPELPVTLDKLHSRIAEELFDKRREIMKLKAQSEKQLPVDKEVSTSQDVPARRESPRPGPPARKKPRID